MSTYILTKLFVILLLIKNGYNIILKTINVEKSKVYENSSRSSPL